MWLSSCHLLPSCQLVAQCGLTESNSHSSFWWLQQQIGQMSLGFMAWPQVYREWLEGWCQVPCLTGAPDKAYFLWCSQGWGPLGLFFFFLVVGKLWKLVWMELKRMITTSQTVLQVCSFCVGKCPSNKGMWEKRNTDSFLNSHTQKSQFIWFCELLFLLL